MSRNLVPCISSERRPRLVWEALIRRWSTSGLSRAEFCRQEGLSLASFYWWSSQLKRQGRSRGTDRDSQRLRAPVPEAGAAALSLIEVTGALMHRAAVKQVATVHPIEIVLPAGSIPGSGRRQRDHAGVRRSCPGWAVIVLTLPPSVRIFLATGPVDMRKSIDGLAALVTELLQQDPFSGFLFVFRGRRSDRVKILVWDRNGFLLVYKRLERGRFHFPDPEGTSAEIEATHLSLLLEGLDMAVAAGAPRWRPSNTSKIVPSPAASGS